MIIIFKLILIIIIIIIIVVVVVKSYEFMVYNYVNFIDVFYDKELLALNYSKLNAFILIHCGLYIIYITMCFNTFEAYFSYISHILTIPINNLK